MLEQRLRRAQHPGHRRQAHSADPQRHEHRSVIGVSDRATDGLNLLFDSDVGRDYLRKRRKLDRGAGRAIRRHRHLRSRQHRRGDQDRQASRLGAERCRSSRSRPTAPRCMRSERRELSARSVIPDGFDEVNAGEIFGQLLEAVADDHVLDSSRPGAQAHLQSRLLHLGRAAGRAASTISSAARIRASGAASSTPCREWDGMIEAFNAEVRSDAP